jgi:hypothetical protein
MSGVRALGAGALRVRSRWRGLPGQRSSEAGRARRQPPQSRAACRGPAPARQRHPQRHAARFTALAPPCRRSLVAERGIRCGGVQRSALAVTERTRPPPHAPCIGSAARCDDQTNPTAASAVGARQGRPSAGDARTNPTAASRRARSGWSALAVTERTRRQQPRGASRRFPLTVTERTPRHQPRRAQWFGQAPRCPNEQRQQPRGAQRSISTPSPNEPDGISHGTRGSPHSRSPNEPDGISRGGQRFRPPAAATERTRPRHQPRRAQWFGQAPPVPERTRRHQSRPGSGLAARCATERTRHAASVGAGLAPCRLPAITASFARSGREPGRGRRQLGRRRVRPCAAGGRRRGMPASGSGNVQAGRQWPVAGPGTRQGVPCSTVRFWWRSPARSAARPSSPCRS